jgi:hypothetical protein
MMPVAPHSKKPRGRYTARLLIRLPFVRFRRCLNQSTKPGMVACRREKYRKRAAMQGCSRGQGVVMPERDR